MIEDLDPVAELIAEAGRRAVTARLHEALGRQAADAGVELAPEELDRLAAEGVAHADAVLWRRALAGAGATELGIGLAEAVRHPAVRRAHALVAAPAYSEDAADAPGASDHLQAPAGGTYEERLAGTAFALSDEPEAGPDSGAGAESRSDASSEADTGYGPEDGADAPDAVRIAAVHLGGIESLRAGERDLELRFSPAGLDVLKRSSGAAIGRLEWEEIRDVDLPRARRGLRPGRRRAQELHVATDRGRASFELPGLTEEQLKEHLEPMLARTRDRRGKAG